MSKAKVAVLKCKPETVLQDVERLCEGSRGEARKPSAKNRTTILKDNISLALPLPRPANTTPWQLEGTIVALKNSGCDDVTAVQNKTVVTNAFKGEDLNNYVPALQEVCGPRPLQLQRLGHEVDRVPPERARMHVLHKIFPDGIPDSRLLLPGRRTFSICRR